MPIAAPVARDTVTAVQYFVSLGEREIDVTTIQTANFKSFSFRINDRLVHDCRTSAIQITVSKCCVFCFRD